LANYRARSRRGLLDGLGEIFKFVARVATVEDIKKLRDRQSVLEAYIKDNQQGARTELGRLLVAEKLLSRMMDLLLNSVKIHARALNEELNEVSHQARGVARELHWAEHYAAKNTRIFHHGTRIINELDNLIQGLTWLEAGVLFPLIVPTQTLKAIMIYIGKHLEHNATLKIHMIPSNLAEFHKMISFCATRLAGKMIITLRVPLTHYETPFDVFKVKAVPIRVPNSELDSVLEVPHGYVAIHESTGTFIAITERKAKEVALTDHYLIRDPMVRVNTNNTCKMAIFRNDAKLAKQQCAYVVRHASRLPMVERLDNYLFYLRNIPRYSIYCQLTVHHDKSLINAREISYTCKDECSVIVEFFELHRIDERDGGVHRVRVIDVPTTDTRVGHTFYPNVDREPHHGNRGKSLSYQFNRFTDLLQRRGIDGASSFAEPADLDLPYHKVEFIDTDEPTRLELEAVLNATGNN